MAKLVADDRTQGDTFGYRVNIYNNYAIVGAPQDDINYSRQGSAYLNKLMEHGIKWLNLLLMMEQKIVCLVGV